MELLLPVVFRFVFAEEDVVLRFLDPSGFLFTAFAVKYSASQSEFPLLLQQEMSCNCNGSYDKAIVGEIFKLLIFTTISIVLMHMYPTTAANTMPIA